MSLHLWGVYHRKSETCRQRSSVSGISRILRTGKRCNCSIHKHTIRFCRMSETDVSPTVPQNTRRPGEVAGSGCCDSCCRHLRKVNEIRIHFVQFDFITESVIVTGIIRSADYIFVICGLQRNGRTVENIQRCIDRFCPGC